MSAGCGREGLGNLATRAQCNGGAPYGRCEADSGVQGALSAPAPCGAGVGAWWDSAVRAAGAAMAQLGRLLKEQKYDRQLR